MKLCSFIILAAFKFGVMDPICQIAKLKSLPKFQRMYYFFFVVVQTIKRAIDRKTVDLYQMFIEELNLVKKEFAGKNPQLPRSQPRNAGLATWARLLKRRIDAPMNVCTTVCVSILTLPQTIVAFSLYFNSFCVFVSVLLCKFL